MSIIQTMTTKKSLKIFIGILCGICFTQCTQKCNKGRDLTKLSKTITQQDSIIKSQKDTIFVKDVYIKSLNNENSELKRRDSISQQRINDLTKKNNNITIRNIIPESKE